MVNIKLLSKGDDVLTINEKFLAIKRKNGEVDIFNVYYNDNELLIDPVKVAAIEYGNGTVEKTSEDGESTIFTF